MSADALTRVLEAAERHARELLNQASEYEQKGFQRLADETLNEHYRPLRDALATLRGDVVIVRRDVAEQAARLVSAFGAMSAQPDLCRRVARDLRAAVDAMRCAGGR
jgi:hypothetical protein